jgi:hypothetical protein
MGKRISIEQFLNGGEPGLPPETTDYLLLIQALGVLPEKMKIVGAVEMKGVNGRGLMAGLSRTGYAGEIRLRTAQVKANRQAFINLQELRIAKDGGLGDVGRLIRNQKDFSKATLFAPPNKEKLKFFS